MADADGVLAPAIGLHLEIDKIEPWSMSADDKLEPALAALEHDDPGQDVDVVVGLVGALPLPTDDLHLAGYSAVLGSTSSSAWRAISVSTTWWSELFSG